MHKVVMITYVQVFFIMSAYSMFMLIELITVQRPLFLTLSFYS